MINIKELSIGNWIQNTNGNIGKVIGITEQGLVVMRYHENSICYSEPSMLNPISITPEILEKNGFVNVLYVDGVWGDDNSYFIHTSSGFDAGTWETHIEPTEGIGDFGGKLKYVHQLQNALTLCGIDKEIKLP